MQGGGDSLRVTTDIERINEMEVLTSVKDILQMARDERCSGYTAELLVKDLNELTALREAGEKMAEQLRQLEGAGFTDAETRAALAEWEAANK